MDDRPWTNVQSIVYRPWSIVLAACFLLIISIGCGLHSQNGTQNHSASPPAPSSPWLEFKGAPPPAAAIGVLSGDPYSENRFRITWANGESSEESERDLEPTPLPMFLPTLGPSKWAAVFDVSQGLALVHGARGWGWTPAGDFHKGPLILFEESFRNRIQSLEDEARKPQGSGGYSQHWTFLIVLEPQEVRREPDDGSPATQQLRSTRALPCDTASNHVAFPKASARTEDPTLTPVRIVEQRGDWARIILPRKNIPWQRCFDAALISWEEEPAGWARLARAGPVVGTKLRLWRFDGWGSWP